MRGKYQQLCSTSTSFFNMNAIICPALHPVLLPIPGFAGAGAEAGGSGDGQGIAGLLADEGLPAQCHWHPGIE